MSKFGKGFLVALFFICTFCCYAYTYTTITLDGLTYIKRSDQEFSTLSGQVQNLLLRLKFRIWHVAAM